MSHRILQIAEQPVQVFRDLEHCKLTNFARYAFYALRELDPRPYIKIRCQMCRNHFNKDAIFIHVPKTAGTSLISVLKENGAMWLGDLRTIRSFCQNRGLISFSHFSLASLMDAGYVSPAYFEKAYKFAFVRNPYDRAVSLYHYSIGTARTLSPSTTFSIFCSYLEQKAYEPIGLYEFRGLSQLNPQKRWLVGADGAKLCDFVGKFENLEDDFDQVRKTLALAWQGERLPRENGTCRRPIASYYTDREMEIVARIYAEDFAGFGYDPSRLPQT